jgi:hypothetical protein
MHAAGHHSNQTERADSYGVMTTEMSKNCAGIVLMLWLHVMDCGNQQIS